MNYTLKTAGISRRLAAALQRAGYGPDAPVASISVTAELLADLRGGIALVELLRLCSDHGIQIADRLWLQIVVKAARDVMAEMQRDTPDQSHLQTLTAYLQQIMECMPARRQRGRPTGSTSADSVYEQIREMRAAGKSIDEIMRLFGKSRAAVYRALKQVKGGD